MIPKMSTYRRDSDEAKYMSFLIKDNDLVKTYTQIWDKVNQVITKGFASESVTIKKYSKTKMENYEETVIQYNQSISIQIFIIIKWE